MVYIDDFSNRTLTALHSIFSPFLKKSKTFFIARMYIAYLSTPYTFSFNLTPMDNFQVCLSILERVFRLVNVWCAGRRSHRRLGIGGLCVEQFIHHISSVVTSFVILFSLFLFFLFNFVCCKIF